MSRLIDADELLKDNIHIVGGIRTTSGKIQNIDAIQTSAIENAPTIDAVPVVRCKDCKFYETKHYYKGICKNIIGMVDVKDGNSFCSYGERKENRG